MITELIKTPLGMFEVTHRCGRISSCVVVDGAASNTAEKIISDDGLAIKRALNDYFNGSATRLNKFNLDLTGTELQQKVWAELRRIPCGETVSYKELAERVGKPKAIRAVASACGKNPALVFVPCHRVIASDKSLGGFSAGLWRKEELLKLEEINPPSEAQRF